MPLRPPPGGSGRIWLARRLEIARRAASLLDQKRSACWQRRTGSQPRLPRRVRAGRTRSALPSAAGPGRRGGGPLAELDGRDLPHGGRRSAGPARPQLARRHCRARASPQLPNAAALEAGVRHAALARALDLVGAELAATTVLQRALERKWVPLLSGALGRLETVLDELEREDAVRSRWLHARAAPAVDRRLSSPGG